MFEVSFNFTVHIVGTVYTDEKPSDDNGVNELLDAVFPGGWEGEVFDVGGEYTVETSEDA